MRVNASKTHDVCIDFSRNNIHCSVEPHIVIDDLVINRVNNVKILGVTISSDLTWDAHVDNIVSKAGKRVYMVYQLKRAGIEQAELLRIYLSIVRPVLEYACPVWSTNIPNYLSQNIEMVENRALRSIYPGVSYDNILTNVKPQCCPVDVTSCVKHIFLIT